MILRIRTILFPFIAGAFLSAAPFSAAQEMVAGNDAGVGARAMGMGGAYTAVSDDISAIYYNPAGLAQIRRIEWNLGVSIAKAKEETFLRSESSSPALGSDTGNKTATSISSFGGVLPFPTYRGSLVFAASFQRVKDFDSQFRVNGYSDSWDGTIKGQSDDTGGLNMWSLAGAVDVSPAVSLGASLDYFRGDHTLTEKKVYFSSSDLWSEMYSLGYDDKIRAWSLRGGMLVRASDTIRFGVTVRLPLTYHFKSSYYDDWYARSGASFILSEHPSAASADTLDTYKGNFSYYVKAPAQVNAGLSWVYRGLTLAGDITYLDWSQSRTDLAEPEYRYRDTLNWRIGAEAAIPSANAFLRCGYVSAPDPYIGYILRSTMEEVVERNRRDFITLGAGILLDPAIMLDISLVHGFWSSEETPRTDESTRNKLFATVSYRI